MGQRRRRDASIAAMQGGRTRAFYRWRVVWGMIILLSAATSMAGAGQAPRIALIIDDMGNNEMLGRWALHLPGSVTYAFLPHTPHGKDLARAAYARHREILLHLPMQPYDKTAHDKGMLRKGMAEAAFRRTLLSDIASIPHVSGVNNHRGSLLTSDTASMRRVMEGLRAFGLFFIDSRTAESSVAEKVAMESGIPTASRNIFLDHVIERKAIEGQFGKLVRMARHRGTAIGIGHPHPETLSVLSKMLPRLKRLGIRLVPVSKLTKLPPRRKLWRASSSLSPKVAKNSKLSPLSICCDVPE